MMLIRRNMASGNKDERKWTKEEILDDIARIKVRLANIERKKEDVKM